VIIQLHSGDPVAAETEFKRIQLAKRHQPQHSAGCVFINPNGESAGAIIDKKLHLKGITIGQAQIAPEHANFIKNLGKASAADVLALIKLIETTAWKKLKLKFKREVIVYESINH
jgi:UDP-N-acetylmuramate dehydrogenase